MLRLFLLRQFSSFWFVDCGYTLNEMKYDVLHAAEVTVSKSFLLPIHSDDEFYDRASKRLQKKKEETGLKANVETAESLLEKRDMLDKEIELVLSELKVEESRMSEAATSSTTQMESVDPLDAFMSNVSSKIGPFVSTHSGKPSNCSMGSVYSPKNKGRDINCFSDNVNWYKKSQVSYLCLVVFTDVCFLDLYSGGSGSPLYKGA
jgi:hypothetical protein